LEIFLYIFAGFLTIASYSCNIMQKAGIIIHRESDENTSTLLKLLV